MAVFKVLRVKVLEPRISWRAPAYGELWRIGDEAGAWMMGCPACGEPLGSPPQAEFNCTCGRTWRKNGEIYDFRYPTD